MSEPVVPFTIIIAEDDDAAAHLIQTNLRRAELDCQFLRLRNGQEVVDLLRDNTARTLGQNKVLLLLDIRMPKMDGIQVLKHIKNTDRLKKMPVVMLTTSDRPIEVQTCYQLGCNAYIRKQVDYGKFVESIKAIASFVKCCEIPIFGELESA